MSLLDILSKITTASGRAYLTLLRSDRFALGLIGPASKISPSQRALTLLIRERATNTLFDLLQRAPLPGQLYALLGLSVSGDAKVAALLADYRQRTDQILTQTACLVGSQTVHDVVAHIEDGTYSKLLNATPTPPNKSR